MVRTLCGLHTVDAVSAELGADDSIAAGQVDVPLAGQRHAGAGQDVLLVEAGDELGQLLLGDLAFRWMGRVEKVQVTVSCR